MRLVKRLAAVAMAVAVATAGVSAVTDGTSNTRTEAGFTTSPGSKLALTSRKAGKGQQEYLLLAIPGVRGTGGGAG